MESMQTATAIIKTEPPIALPAHPRMAAAMVGPPMAILLVALYTLAMEPIETVALVAVSVLVSSLLATYLAFRSARRSNVQASLAPDQV